MPSIESTVAIETVRVEVLDQNWDPIPAASGDYLTRDDAEAYIRREFAALKSAARLFDTTTFVMPIFTIDGEQYVPEVTA